MSVPLRAIPAAAKAIVAVLFIALFFFGLQAPGAAAAPISELTVVPTVKTGGALTGLHVYAYPVDGHTITGEGVEAVPLAGSDAGKYVFSASEGNALDESSQYTFYFDAPSSVTTAFDQFYGGTTWVEEAATWNYDGHDLLALTLATNTNVTGKVTGTKSKALSGVTVYPYRWDGNDWFLLANAKAVTNSAGRYTMRGLEPGTYRLEFAPDNRTGYRGEYSGNKTSFEAATALTLGLGTTLTHNARLSVGGSISGKVSIYLEGVQLPPYGITAYAYPVLPGGAIDTSHVYVSKVTTTSGAWKVSGLPTGDYKVKLYDTDSYAFVDKWAGANGGGETSMDPDTGIFHVTSGKTTTVSGIARLDFFEDVDDTSLLLTVDDANGQPLGDDSLIYIESTSGEDFFYASDPDDSFDPWSGGVLNVAFMPVGDYRLWIDPRDGISQPYVETQHIGTGGNTWEVELDPVSAFTYDTPPVIAESGSATGTEYEVDPGATSLDDGSGVEADVEYTYIWLRGDPGAPIFGAQSADQDHYVTRGADFTNKVSVIVQADAFGYPTVFHTVTAADPVTIADAPVNAEQAFVDFSGSPKPGSVLRANPGEWDQRGLSFTYQWTRNGTEIPTATGRSYTVQPADAGAAVGFTIQAHKTGYADSAIAPSSNQPVIGFLSAPRLTKSPKFRATAVGNDLTLSSSSGSWSPRPTAYLYDWYVDGALAQSSASSSYDCTGCNGHAIELTVNALRDGYQTGTRHYIVRKSTLAPVLTTPAVVTDQSAGAVPIESDDIAQIGHVLKATPQVYAYDGPGGTLSYSYQWLRNGSAISKATKSTYAPRSADVNKTLSVRITVRSSLYKTTSAVTAAGVIGKKLDLVDGVKPTVSIVGSELHGYTKKVRISGPWAVSKVTQRYQWYVCVAGAPSGCTDTSSPDYVASPGATGSTFVPTSTGPELFIAVEVRGSRSGYATASVRSDYLELDSHGDADDFVVFSDPVYTSGLVSGDAVTGRTVKVRAGTIDRPADAVHDGRWVVCPDADCATAADIPGATSTSYTPTADLFTGGDRWIRYVDRWTIGSPGITTEAVTPTAHLVPATWSPRSAPRLTSVAATSPARHYTVSNGSWPGGVIPTFTYEWYDGTELVSTDSSFDTEPTGPAPAWVKVTAHRQGYASRVFTLVIHKGSLPAMTPALSGTQYGDTLSLTTPVVLPLNAPAASLRYQWYSGSKAIKGATKPTIRPSSSYVNKTLRLKITASSIFYNTKAFMSASVVLAPHLASPAVPTVKSSPNTFKPGAKLTVGRTGYPSKSTFTYKWQRSTDGGATWSTISTRSSYRLTTSDPGPDHEIRVLVTHKKSGWTTSTTPSLAWAINPTDDLEHTSAFTLAGSAMVDTKISAPIAWNTSRVAVTYEWYRNGIKIPGATSSSVTPTASWFGDDIQARVTATKPGWTSTTVSSNIVQVQLGSAPTSRPLTTNPAVPHTGSPVTISSGVWNVAGVTLSYAWFSDSGLLTEVGTSPTYTPSAEGHYWAVVTAHRQGYADGTVVKEVTVVSP